MFINDRVVLSRAPDGPLAAYIGAFAKSRSAHGYARVPFTGRCCSLRVSAAGLNKREWLRHISSDHLSRYLRDRLDGCGLAWAMLPRSGTSLIFCAVRA